MYASDAFVNNLGEYITHPGQTRRNTFLDGASFAPSSGFVKVAPAPLAVLPTPLQKNVGSVVFDTLKPMIVVLRLFGLLPVASTGKGTYGVTAPLAAYSAVVFLGMLGYIGYIKWDKVEIVKSAEGRFEEAVIDYLFTVYLIPILVIPVSWYECRKMARVFADWAVFERIYEGVEGRLLPVFQGNKPLVVTLALPILSCGTMVVTHVTMVYFRLLQVVPYCYVNTLTFIIGGFWYLHADVIGKIATLVADDFQKSLKHIGPSSKVADYRSLWMLLARITRSVGLSSCYVLMFICLYLFLIITLTIYGLLSTLQEGFSIKDVGLFITALFSIALLYFICDEAHYASNCVRVYFQKKLLLVELSWMNEDAQQEINMFLRATEMNPTDMSLGGYFDVNRNLFKSLLATMVTYLVVLLQFQISIPEDMDVKVNGTSIPAPAPK